MNLVENTCIMVGKIPMPDLWTLMHLTKNNCILRGKAIIAGYKVFQLQLQHNHKVVHTLIQAFNLIV